MNLGQFSKKKILIYFWRENSPVELEAELAGIDSDRNGSNGCDSLLQGSFVSSWNVNVSRTSGSGCRSFIVAGTILKKKKRFINF